MKLSLENKKYVWAAGVLIVVILVAVGINQWRKPTQAEADAAAHPCAINILATFIFNVSATTTKESIAKTLLTQYLNAYEHVPLCPSEGVKDYKIISIGAAKDVPNASEFIIPVTFDISPASRINTSWATTTVQWDGDWIRGKEATLGIEHIQVAPDAATSTYRLLI